MEKMQPTTKQTMTSLKLRKALAIMALALAPVAPLFGQGTISQVYAPLSTDFQDCAANKRAPMYYPALYLYPDGSLGMITQGNCLGACDPGMGDSLFRWKRSVNGSWKAELGGLSPARSRISLQSAPGGALSSAEPPWDQIVQRH